MIQSWFLYSPTSKIRKLTKLSPLSDFDLVFSLFDRIILISRCFIALPVWKWCMKSIHWWDLFTSIKKICLVWAYIILCAYYHMYILWISITYIHKDTTLLTTNAIFNFLLESANPSGLSWNSLAFALQAPAPLLPFFVANRLCSCRCFTFCWLRLLQYEKPSTPVNNKIV